MRTAPSYEASAALNFTDVVSADFGGPVEVRQLFCQDAQQDRPVHRLGTAGTGRGDLSVLAERPESR